MSGEQTEPVDWGALSALYDDAHALPPHERAAWVARLKVQGHPLAAWLPGMLDGTAGFLDTLPPLHGPAAGLAAGTAGGADVDAAEDWQAQPGQQVGAYRLLRPLGAGGMAEVWLATRSDGAFERQVALKLLVGPVGLASRQQALRRRFEREHRILASLRHPHIAALHDAGVSAADQHWLAMEYVAGAPIDQWCDSRRLGLLPRVLLFMQVLQAVSHAHARLVLHRDLKPSNVMVCEPGEVRLLDFGIATLLDAGHVPRAATELTLQAGRPLTPRYASPEQLQGEPLDVTSDVYALGVVLYELLCGQAPYATAPGLAGALERAIVDGGARAPSRHTPSAAALQARGGVSARAWRRQVAGELDAIVLRAMAPRREARYSSADALAADLSRWLAGEPVQARLPGPAARAWKFCRRHPWGTGLGAAAMAGLAVATALATHSAGQARNEAARARAASGFLLQLFEDADPDRHGGRELTPAQLLASSRARLGPAANMPPALRRELLDGIAHAQAELGDFEAAEASLADWVALCQQHCDKAQQAWAWTRRAENAMRLGRYAQAADHLALADAALPDADAPPVLHGKRAEVRGLLAHYQGQLDVAARAIAGGLQALQGSPPSGGLAPAAAGLQQAFTLHLANAQNEAERGRPAAAEHALAQAGRLHAAVVRERPMEAQVLPMARAIVWDRLGQYQRVAQQAPADLAACEGSLGSASQLCRKLRARLVHALWRRGDDRPGAALWPDLRHSAEKAQGGREQLAAWRNAQRVAWLAQDAASLQRVAIGLHPLAEGDGPALLRARAALYLAEGALMSARSVPAGQSAQSGYWVAQARGQQQAAVPDRLFEAQLDLADGLARAAAGQAEAGPLLQRAQAGLAAEYGQAHALVHWFGLNRAAWLWRNGQAVAARALVDAAWPVLQASLGADAPALVRVQRLRQAMAATPETPLAELGPFL